MKAQWPWARQGTMGALASTAKFPNLQKSHLSLNPFWLRVNRDYAFAGRRNSFSLRALISSCTLIIIIGPREADYTPLAKEINLYSQEKRHVWLGASGPKIMGSRLRKKVPAHEARHT